MVSLQFSKLSHTPRIDQAVLVASFMSYVRLTRSGFPSSEARKMVRLLSDQEFERARQAYETMR